MNCSLGREKTRKSEIRRSSVRKENYGTLLAAGLRHNPG